MPATRVRFLLGSPVMKFLLCCFTLKKKKKKIKSHCRTQSILKNLSGSRTCSHSEKQNVRQTTYRNNSSNGWRTSPEHYSESNKQHSNSFQKTTRVLLSFTILRFNHQIQDVYVSKSRIIGKIAPHAISKPQRHKEK